jgi:hypothetical protein
MVAYEIYSYDEINGYNLMGILPERRKDPKRITKESVLKWGRMFLNGTEEGKNIVFKQIVIDDVSHEMIEVKEPSPFIRE